jgi:hypothetical protein
MSTPRAIFANANYITEMYSMALTPTPGAIFATYITVKYPIGFFQPADLSLDTLKASFIHYIKQCADEEHPLVVFQGLFLKFMTFKGERIFSLIILTV